MPYATFRADVTASRHCLVGFTVLQEKSQRGGGWDPVVSRWTKTEFLKPGKNTVTGPIHDSNNYAINVKNGKVVRFEIFLYAPHEGESIYVDNIRLSTAKETQAPDTTKFAVLGTDLAVTGVRELGLKFKDRWTKPEDKSLDQVEAEFRTQYDTLKKTHPAAVLAVLRDGEKGYDPAHPDAAYAGWKDAYWSSHGPDGMTLERTDNIGKQASHEIFMRHRSPLMRVDLASIPKGSAILAARLVVIRATDKYAKEHTPEQPNMWVVEPCNRPWEEYEVNAYEYAKDKFWKAIGGQYYGDDPDFLPVYLAHGPSQGKVNVWDFTNAVRFWTDARQPRLHAARQRRRLDGASALAGGDGGQGSAGGVRDLRAALTRFVATSCQLVSFVTGPNLKLTSWQLVATVASAKTSADRAFAVRSGRRAVSPA